LQNSKYIKKNHSEKEEKKAITSMHVIENRNVDHLKKNNKEKER